MIIFKLKQLLDTKERNQRSLKLETGIRSGTVNAYYHGFIKRMNVDDINKICNALGCSVSDLFEHIPDKK